MTERAPGGGKVLLVVTLIGAAAVVSGALYSRSRSADFDRHAEVVAAIGTLRHVDERLAELVLAARFGLLNQYDSLTETERSIAKVTAELRTRVTAVMEPDLALEQALRAVEGAAAEQLVVVERFKAENAILKNSIHYLPTAAEETDLAFERSDGPGSTGGSLIVHRLIQAVLVQDVIGDESTRKAYRAALAELRSILDGVPAGARAQVTTLLAHATVIGDKELSVDARVKQVFDSGNETRISAVEGLYQRHFAETVTTSNRYRKILYVWSLFLLAAASAAAFELRRMYVNLERRVAERTTELRSALDALWGEMRLASKIQHALVPTVLEVADGEIAATMKAIDAVGGDYYDVVRAGDADWILIGDVSGHGVPAGLVMMMCHTAVRTLLRFDPGISPDRLLSAVNGVLTENIRQLGEDKYMTISALRRERDGTVFFAGAHQDLQIFRAGTNQVEAIETTGLWLGLRDEIGDVMKTHRFRLMAGDVLLLHTDGITEAIHDGDVFDTEGVRRVLGDARDRTAEEVLSRVFAALDGYEVTDDATVLVLKQLAVRHCVHPETHADPSPFGA